MQNILVQRILENINKDSRCPKCARMSSKKAAK